MARKKGNPRRKIFQKSIPKPRTFEDYSSIVELWVKEPPTGTFPLEDLGSLPSPYTTEMDKEIPIESRLALIVKQREFERTKNPILGIEAFLIARKAKLLPPMCVIDWLEKAFSDFHIAQGTRSLEKILGLVPGRGQGHLFKTLLEEERDEMLALDVWRLMLLFNTSLETASEMVSRRLAETPDWNKTRYKIHPISAKTIADRYKKKWKKILDGPDRRYRLLRDWTKAEAETYLKKFPRDSYKPEDIRPTITS